MNLVYIVATCVLSVLYAWTLYNIPILVVGVRHMRRRSGRKGERASRLSAEELPVVSVIVPVKDEERVVGRLLRALLRLDYPPEKMEIIIVEDGSVDKTVEICREYARRYSGQVRLFCQQTSNGKPSALNYALEHVKGEIVAVFDADSVPEPDALLRAVEHFEDPSVAAVQGRACSINADVNMLTKFISYEEAVRYETYLRGKDVLNLFVPLTGSCCFVRRSVLLEVDGWDDASLSEDMEVALKLTRKGYHMKYAPEIRYWQEYPVQLAQLIEQRIRWFRGAMEMMLKYGKLMTEPSRRNVDAEMTLIGPYMFILCLLSYVMLLQTLVVPIQQNFVFVAVNQITFLITMVPLFLIGVALICVTKPRRAGNLLWLPFIYAYWVLQNFLALYAFFLIVFRRPKKWTKTVKNGITCSRDFKERLIHDSETIHKC
jgi:cellulose synthase/poly-beta-1,6-N-acetylglucosamine synthase-like glycosyltransferase